MIITVNDKSYGRISPRPLQKALPFLAKNDDLFLRTIPKHTFIHIFCNLLKAFDSYPSAIGPLAIVELKLIAEKKPSEDLFPPIKKYLQQYELLDNNGNIKDEQTKKIINASIKGKGLETTIELPKIYKNDLIIIKAISRQLAK